MVSGTDREFNAYLYLWNLEKFSLILSHTPSTALLFSVDYISFSPMFRIRIICSHPIVPTHHNLTPHSALLHNLHSTFSPHSLHILLHNHPTSNSLLAGDAHHLYIIPREACPITPLQPSSMALEINNTLVDLRVRQLGSSAKRKLSK